MKVICNDIVPLFCLHVVTSKTSLIVSDYLVLQFSAVLVLLPSPKGTFRSSNQQDRVLLLSNCIFMIVSNSQSLLLAINHSCMPLNQ